MADRPAALNAGHRSCSFHRRCRPDICVPPSCCRNWACFISALFAALFVLYCSSPVRSNLRTQARVQGPTSSGVSLAYVASDRAARPRCYALRLHSPCRNYWPEANPAASVSAYCCRIVVILSDPDRPILNERRLLTAISSGYNSRYSSFPTEGMGVCLAIACHP